MARDSKAERERRLAAALRANLPRRKAAVRERAREARSAHDGPGAAPTDGGPRGETRDTLPPGGGDTD